MKLRNYNFSRDGRAPLNSHFQELPSSEAVKTQVTDSLANAAEKLTSLSWKERPAFYDNAIRDAVRHLKTRYNRSKPFSEGLMRARTMPKRIVSATTVVA